MCLNFAREGKLFYSADRAAANSKHPAHKPAVFRHITTIDFIFHFNILG